PAPRTGRPGHRLSPGPADLRSNGGRARRYAAPGATLRRSVRSASRRRRTLLRSPRHPKRVSTRRRIGRMNRRLLTIYVLLAGSVAASAAASILVGTCGVRFGPAWWVLSLPRL